MINLRASAANIWSHCGASMVEPVVKVATAGEWAAIGTGTHHVLRHAIADELPTDKIDEEIEAVADSLDVDKHQLGILARMGLGFWRQLKDHFPEPMFEVEMKLGEGDNGDEPEIVLTGHADLLSMLGQQIRIIDWKSGYGDFDHRPQLRAYALLALNELPEAKTVYAAVMNVRSGNLEPYEWTRQQILDWWERTVAIVLDQATYRPGEWCRFCPRALECPALEQAARSAATALAVSQSPVVNGAPAEAILAPQTVGDLHDAYALIKPLLERVHDLVKAQVAANGGTLPLPDGRELILREEERKEPLATAVGTSMIHNAVKRDGVPVVEPEAIFKVRKGELEKAVRAASPPRQGTKQFKALMARLEESGNVQTTWIQKLEMRRAKDQIQRIPVENPIKETSK